jgi:hypothetical protein
MIQIALVALSIGLIVLGVKGFTRSGLAFSKTTTLTGPKAKIVGGALHSRRHRPDPLIRAHDLGFSSR